MRCHAALLAAIFVGSAWGLRLQATPSEPLRSGDQAAKLSPPAPADFEAVRAGGRQATKQLPRRKILESLWEGDQQKERSGVPFLGEVQLVLGVFATERDDPRIRKVIRRFWMDQPGVCMLSGGQNPNCSVYTAFVLGNCSVTRHYSDHELVLNVSENMNGGKTFDFFRHAANSFPWATHIAKMDLDTFPYLRRLTESLRQHVGSKCQHYFGRAVGWGACGGWSRCPPKECSKPVGEDFLKYGVENSTKCWSYMHGGLYGMSTSLARSLTTPGSWWDRAREGIEDLTAGKAVGIYARENNLCVSAWNPLAWDHIGNLSSIKKVKIKKGKVVWKHAHSIFDE